MSAPATILIVSPADTEVASTPFTRREVGRGHPGGQLVLTIPQQQAPDKWSLPSSRRRLAVRASPGSSVVSSPFAPGALEGEPVIDVRQVQQITDLLPLDLQDVSGINRSPSATAKVANGWAPCRVGGTGPGVVAAWFEGANHYLAGARPVDVHQQARRPREVFVAPESEAQRGQGWSACRTHPSLVAPCTTKGDFRDQGVNSRATLLAPDEDDVITLRVWAVADVATDRHGRALV